MTQVDLSNSSNLIVGIVHVVEFVDKPRITIGIRILDGHRLTTLQGEYEVAGVQHVQNRTDAVAIHLRHVSTSFRNTLKERLHLRIDISLYHLLITAQLGSMVATDALMIIGCLVLIEGVRCQIQHTIVEVLVSQDQFVSLCFLLRSLALCLRHEHLIVQITLIHLPQVNQTEHENSPHRIFRLELTILT